MSFLKKYQKEFAEYDKLDHNLIDDDKIWAQLNKWKKPSREDVWNVLKKAEQCVLLEPEETAILLQNRDDKDRNIGTRKKCYVEKNSASHFKAWRSHFFYSVGACPAKLVTYKSVKVRPA